VNAPVSIVISFFNAERFLRETLDSVFAQRFTDWELVLVDDGSSDAGTEIASQTAHSNPQRVLYIDHAVHSNIGLGPSRDVGIQHARGEWIALLDADDLWLPNKLERQFAIANERPRAELIFGRPQYWRSWNGGEDDIREFGALNGLYEPPELLLATILGAASPPPPSDVMFRRDLWQRVEGFERDFPAMYEDQVFLAKCMSVAPAYVAAETWTRYRRHNASMEAAAASNAAFAYGERMRFLRWLDETFAAHDDPRVRNAVRKLTWPVRRRIIHRLLWRTRKSLSRARSLLT
jgi:glycosyltransferase involved in cell wall biosynthesis